MINCAGFCLAIAMHVAGAQLDGQQRDAVDELVRVWIAEAGFKAHRSHAVIAHVLRRHAERTGGDLVSAADALVWRFSNAQADRPWLRYVTADCAQPDGLSAHAWAKRRPLCDTLVERAEAFVRGELRDPCPRADGWRTRGKTLRRALRNGFARVPCRTTVAFVRSA